MNNNIFLYISCFFGLVAIVLSILVLLKVDKNCAVKDSYTKVGQKLKTNNPQIVRQILIQNLNLSESQINNVINKYFDKVQPGETSCLSDGGQYLEYANQMIQNQFTDSDTYAVIYTAKYLGYLDKNQIKQFFGDSNYQDNNINNAIQSKCQSQDNNYNPNGGGNFGSKISK
jgi:hypothetical protein